MATSYQSVSHADFQDFTLKERRHVYKDNANLTQTLGPGLVPLVEEKLVPQHLERPRVVHDGADMYMDPDSFAATATRGTPVSAQPSPWVSSYQAACNGEGTSSKRKMGKRIVEPANASRAPTTFLGGGPAAFGRDRAPPLEAGTTKASLHVPGYTGHIPVVATDKRTSFQPRSTDKALFAENYHPFPGCTKRSLQ